MLRHERSAPIWLFSFVDLAFLLLIAFTQIGPDEIASRPPLAELEIPRIGSEGPSPRTGREAPTWQLRVHPVASNADPTSRLAFELVEAAGDKRAPDSDTAAAQPRPGQRIDSETLASHLTLIRERDHARPLLAPHRDSRSEDLLVAVDLLETVWTEGRRVVVRPTPPVAAAPATEPNR